MNLRLISRTSPVWTAAQIRLALNLFQNEGLTAPGQEVLQEAIAKQPDFPDLYLYSGLLYEEEKNLDEAIKIVDRGIERAPQDPELLFRKGVLLDKKGDKNAAIEVMRKILETDPKNANALNYIGYTYAEMGIKLEEAKQMIKAALESEPDDGYIMDSLAWVHYRMGQHRKALEVILEAIKRVPRDPVIQEHLGDIYLGLGKKPRPPKPISVLWKLSTLSRKIQEKLRR